MPSLQGAVEPLKFYLLQIAKPALRLTKPISMYMIHPASGNQICWSAGAGDKHQASNFMAYCLPPRRVRPLSTALPVPVLLHRRRTRHCPAPSKLMAAVTGLFEALSKQVSLVVDSDNLFVRC